MLRVEWPERSDVPAGTRTIEDHVSAPVPLRLRPLEIGDVLDETFRLYRRNFLLLAGLSVGFSIPLAAFAGYGYSALFGELFNQASSSNPGDFTTFAPALAALATGVVINFIVVTAMGFLERKVAIPGYITGK